MKWFRLAGKNEGDFMMKMEPGKISKGVFFIVLSAFSLYLIIGASAEETGQKDGGIIHVIKKGDTLWDISAEYLDNPFLWPGIWKNNKYIKNPDLIFPGNKLVIPGSGPAEKLTGEQAAGEDVNVETGTTATPAEGNVTTLQPGEVEIPERIRSGASNISSSHVNKTTGKGYVQEPPVPIIGEEMVFTGGYVADIIRSSGQITGTTEDKNISSSGDSVNILFNKEEKAVVGDRYTIFRKPKSVVNQETGKEVGSLFAPVGILEIYRVQGRDAGGRIIKSYDYISSGDHIQPVQPAAPVNAISYAAAGIKGYVVGTRRDTDLTAQYNIVYIDRGSKDGITPGAIFKVIGDGTNKIIGELMIISVHASTSTAFVTRSTEPFGTGNRVITSDVR